MEACTTHSFGPVRSFGRSRSFVHRNVLHSPVPTRLLLISDQTNICFICYHKRDSITFSAFAVHHTRRSYRHATFFPHHMPNIARLSVAEHAGIGIKTKSIAHKRMMTEKSVANSYIYNNTLDEFFFCDSHWLWVKLSRYARSSLAGMPYLDTTLLQPLLLMCNLSLSLLFEMHFIFRFSVLQFAKVAFS